MKYEITSKKMYHETMVAVYDLMNKGEANLTKKELNRLETMATAAEKYEDEVLGLKPGKNTIAVAVEKKMQERKLNQTKLAAELGLAKSKLSEILNGKRSPDVAFLKGIHKILHIDADFLLKHA